ncbi:MAG TPA: ribosome maturation factor RimP [Clostridia bacterium]|jgi:ribosome maturation factor RimP|nr:ribosome maturation factor RimP [Clostridia bacterium]
MQSKMADLALNIVKEPIEKMGYEIVEIKCNIQNANETHLTIYIFSFNGITLEDCVKVNDVIDPLLDEFDISNGKPYILNVSSPGLDRQIVTNDDFRRNINEIVDVKVFQKGLKGNFFTGKIISYTDNHFELELLRKKTIIEINRDNVQSLSKHIKFK